MILDKKKRIHISVFISDDKEVKTLNKKYLNRNIPTDVLSFSVNEELDDGSYYLGDVIVNREQAEKQMKKYNNDLPHEIAELVTHGVLHLLGVHHADDDEVSIHGKAAKQ